MTGRRLLDVARLRLWVGLAALILGLPGASYAQRFTAELNGTVLDESGAAVPGADAVLTNEASGSVRRSVTNANGFFAFSAVPAGNYKVHVSLTGFSSFEITGVALNAGDSRSLREIRLKVAALAETVSVTAEVQLAPLNSGERSTTLTAEVIQNIPIVSSSAAELLRVLPGMTAITQGVTNRPGFTGEVIGINGNGEYQGGGGNNQSAIGNFSANGTRTTSLDITVDGAPGADPGCNCATSVNPNTEFVQEFKVLSVELRGRARQGPERDERREQVGRARLPRLGLRLLPRLPPELERVVRQQGRARARQEQVRLPGLHVQRPALVRRLQQEQGQGLLLPRLRVLRPEPRHRLHPLLGARPQAMRNGDFSNAASRRLAAASSTACRTFPGGIVPPSQIDPGGQVLLNRFPLPNANPAQTGGWNYVDNLLVDQPNRQALARIDFNLSDNTKLFVRYNYQRETQPWVIGLWWRNGQRQVPYPTSISSANASDSVTASLTHVFDPTLTQRDDLRR